MTILNLFLVGLVAGLGYLLMAGTAPEDGPSALAPVDPVLAATSDEGPGPASPPRFELPPRDLFSVISARPLFRPDRRPVPAEPVEVATQSAPVIPPPNIRLSGIMMVGDQPRALMALLPGPAEIYAEGDRVRGWRISRIDPDGIELTFGVRTHRVMLDGTEAGDTREPTRAASRPSASKTGQSAGMPTYTDMSEQID